MQSVKHAPSILVLLVQWNRPIETLQCIKSLGKTGYPFLSIYVVDNASGSDAFQILEAEANGISLIRSPINAGYAGGFNLGLQAALTEEHPDYVWLLNNDTTVAPDCPQQLIQAAIELGPAILSPKILDANNAGHIWYAGGYLDSWLKSHHVGRGDADLGQYDVLRRVPWGSGCSLFFPTSVAARIGPMSEDYFLYLEDVDWCLRASTKGILTYYIPAALVNHGVSKSVELLDSRAVVYYGWRNYYILATRHGSLVQKAHAWCDLFSRLIKTAVKLFIFPSARHDHMYAARTQALLDFLRRRGGPAPFTESVPVTNSETLLNVRL